MAVRLPLAVLLLALLLAAPAAAGKYSGRMVIIRHAAGTSRVGGAAGARSRWHYRRLEDEVAPEFGGVLAADNGHIGYDALDKDTPGCKSGNQCTKPGGSYTRSCTYKEQCPHG